MGRKLSVWLVFIFCIALISLSLHSLADETASVTCTAGEKTVRVTSRSGGTLIHAVYLNGALESIEAKTLSSVSYEQTVTFSEIYNEYYYGTGSKLFLWSGLASLKSADFTLTVLEPQAAELTDDVASIYLTAESGTDTGSALSVRVVLRKADISAGDYRIVWLRDGEEIYDGGQTTITAEQSGIYKVRLDAVKGRYRGSVYSGEIEITPPQSFLSASVSENVSGVQLEKKGGAADELDKLAIGDTLTASGAEQKLYSITYTNGGQTITTYAENGEIEIIVTNGDIVITDAEFMTEIQSVSIGGYAAEDIEIIPLVEPSGAECLYCWQTAVSPDDKYATVSSAQTYTPSHDDAGKYIKLTVSGTGKYTSEKTAYIAAPIDKAAYTVTFDLNFASASNRYDTQTVRAGENLSQPDVPVRTGFTFSGWYKETECENEFDFNTAVAENITLYAKWSADKNYESFFDGAITAVSLREDAPDSSYAELKAAEARTVSGLSYADGILAAERTDESSSPVVMQIDKTQLDLTRKNIHLTFKAVNIRGNGHIYMTQLDRSPNLEQLTFGTVPADTGGTAEFEGISEYDIDITDMLNGSSGDRLTLKFTAENGSEVLLSDFSLAVTQMYSVSISESNENGAIKTDKVLAREGETVTLTVSPSGEYNFSGFDVSDDIEIIENNGNYSFVMPAKDIFISGTFEQSGKAVALRIVYTTAPQNAADKESTAVYEIIENISANETIAAASLAKYRGPIELDFGDGSGIHRFVYADGLENDLTVDEDELTETGFITVYVTVSEL